MVSKGSAVSPRPAQDADTLLHQAEHLLEDDDVEGAEAAFRRLLGAPSHRSRGLYGIGVCRLVAGDRDGAYAYFERALDHDPAHANALYHLGAGAEAAGDRARARALYERAIAAAPTHNGALRSLQRLRVEESPAVPTPVVTADEDRGSVESGVAVYDLLRGDSSPLARQTCEAMDRLQVLARPSLIAHAGRHAGRFLVRLALMLLAPVAALVATRSELLASHAGIAAQVRSAAVIVLAAVAAVAALVAVGGYLRVRSTVVKISRGRMQICSGILAQRLQNVDLWRVHGVELQRSLVNRLTGDGTLTFELLNPYGRMATEKNTRPLHVVGIARGAALDELYQRLLNVVFLLRSNPVVKGIVQ